jgi:hypothetical protein
MLTAYADEITLPPASRVEPEEKGPEFPRVTLVRNVYNEVDAIVFGPEQVAPQPVYAPVAPTTGYYFSRPSLWR